MEVGTIILLEFVQCMNLFMAPFDVRRDAAIRLQLGE